MLPTTGFFQDIDCPFYETECGRPYCHFRHRKKPQEANDETQQSEKQEIPTYKPTPKSELANNTKSHIPISYVPDLVVRSERILRPVPSYSFKDKPTYKPTPKSLLSSQNLTNDCEYKPTAILKAPETITQETENEQNDELNLDGDLSTAFDMIDEILNESVENVNDDASNAMEMNNEETINEVKHDDRENTDQIVIEEKKEKSKSNRDKKSEKDIRHRKDKYSRNSSSSSSSNKTKQRDKDKDKHRNKDSKESKESKSKSKEKSSHKDKEKEKEKEKDRSREKSKSSSDKHRSSSNSKSHRHKHDKHERDKKRHKEEKLSDVKKPCEILANNDDFDYEDAILSEEEIEDSIEEECYKIFNEYKPPVIEKSATAVPPTAAAMDSQPDEEYTPLPGKKRIAYDNADKSASLLPQTKQKPVSNVAYIMTNRIRIARQAHANNEQKNLIKEIKRQEVQQQAQGIKRNITTSLVVTKPKVPKILPKPNVNNGTNSLIDDIINGRSAHANKPVRKIAPVLNVNSIQRAKARLDEIAKIKAAQALKTSSQTLNKGAKRVAHMPDTSLGNIPDVLHAEKSKLPVNVRTRYLTLLADECVKLYATNEEAYQRALNEEFKCYERCSALTTYRNSSMLAVNRLRKEVQEREAAGLGPMHQVNTNAINKNSPLQGRKFYQLIKKYVLNDNELLEHGYPREGPTAGQAIINPDKRSIVASDNLGSNERICCRCKKNYLIDDDGFPLIEEECNYHPLRKRTFRGERFYLCCKSTEDVGCAMSNCHVSEVSADRELEGYQSTMPSENESDLRNFTVYALDCEMCYTTKGLELTRVTIVDINLKTVYETLVKPLNPIIDYNTRFSGITKEQMDRTSTSILQVQANILHLCNSKTILIGHSLESDMKALKIIHSSIIDTSVMFPHKFGLPHKRALRSLASEYLKKIIQNDVGGHDSAEDALACMELVIWKVKEELKVKGIKYS